MSKADVEKLEAARALVATGWTQGAYARNLNGKIIDESHPDACFFCASGALWRVGALLGSSARMYLLRIIESSDVPNWNDADDRTQADVVAAFTAASNLARAAEWKAAAEAAAARAAAAAAAARAAGAS